MIALIGVALFRHGDRAMAIQDSEDKVWFGPVGITPGERALVNVYAIGDPDIMGPLQQLSRAQKKGEAFRDPQCAFSQVALSAATLRRKTSDRPDPATSRG